jgi:hypothetical protein
MQQVKENLMTFVSLLISLVALLVLVLIVESQIRVWAVRPVKRKHPRQK